MKRYITFMIFIFLLAGCVSVPTSPNPRFYMLRSAAKDQMPGISDPISGIVVAVGPIKIPEYQDRPQIVTQDRDGMLTFAQFDRWGESLDQGIQRVIAENLATMLPKAVFGIFPCNHAIPVKYQVIAEIIKLDSDINGAVSLTVQWSVIDAKTNKMLFTQRSEFLQEADPHTYHGLVQALSLECESLSRKIAEVLVSLETKNSPSKNNIMVQK